ncbi:DUF4184 family protein [Paenibacillus sp. GCM10028914]|uniref:DUF4184 family protein n=1 Tax=Paenibacillus sp. GCM10028914 TaxID=3273416 RepID=UPI0036200283
MPLTFAHPAAVLPFSRKSKYVHFSALVLGSMSPDFEYFLRGQPLGEIGHTFRGFLYFNLPLVIVIYFIYHTFIHRTLVNHLPVVLQDSNSRRPNYSGVLSVIVFFYSALIGMLTHIVWDSFTHKNGFMVTELPILAHTFNISSYDIPIYKLLQHGSTLLGLCIILIYVYVRASLSREHNMMKVSPKQKVYFWSSLFVLAAFILVLWYFIDYVSIMSYGIAVVRVIDSALLSLLIVCLTIKIKRYMS